MPRKVALIFILVMSIIIVTGSIAQHKTKETLIGTGLLLFAIVSLVMDRRNKQKLTKK